MLRKSLLDGNRDHLLAEARSELVKAIQSGITVLSDWNWRTPIVENFLTFSVKPSVFPSPRSMLKCDKRLPLDTLKFV